MKGTDVKRLLPYLAAISIAVAGFVHFRLWHGVYHGAPIKEMFLLNVTVSAFVAVAILIPGRVAPLGAMVLSAGSLGALALSRTIGLPTTHGLWKEVGLAPAGQTLFGASDTLLVIVAETITLLASTALLILAARKRRPEDQLPGRAGGVSLSTAG